MPTDLPAPALNKIRLVCSYTKKRGDPYRHPFHCLRPSHCPMMLNEQREAHADVFIYNTSPYATLNHTRTGGTRHHTVRPTTLGECR